MRLTIIPSDEAVYVDGKSYLSLKWEGTPADVHALQWFEVEGWIEYKGDVPNEAISSLPNWANNAYDAWVKANNPPPPPPLTAEQNKDTAIELLSATDWSVLSSITDPMQSNPYLANQEAFITYRNEIRQIAINPIAGDIVWPEKPQATWINV